MDILKYIAPSEAVTHNVRVSVKSIYIEKESNLFANRHLFAYFVTIRNESDRVVQLMDRYWKIVNIGGKEFEVTGDGVVGKQPVLKPGQSFGYNSYCVLYGFEGYMEGYYRFRDQGRGTEPNASLKIEVPQFQLRSILLN